MANGVTPDDIALKGVRYARGRLGDWLAEIGRVSEMMLETTRACVRRLPAARLIVQQMRTIGVDSLWLVVVVSLFTGAVAAVQAAYQFTSVVPLKYLSGVILRSVVIELGPVLTALVIGGRVGASIAAELGTMKVTEQIDALRAMGISPLRYLVAPRVLAAIFMLPVLTIYADAVAILGGFVVAVTALSVPGAIYAQGLREFFQMKDLLSGLVKAVFFGNIIGVMGCYHGFQTEGGAEGVGRATTMAVVSSCVLILVLDYILATVLFRVLFRMIEIRGLAKRLGRKQVLKDLDLDVRKGETLVVLGPSGTGKSVLLKHIIGLMRPDAGSIRIDGEETVGLSEEQLNPVRRRFGMLFQGAALLDSMTVGENVALAMQEHAREMEAAEVRRRVTERLEWVGLKDAAALKPSSLSGGMRKRVGLARALAMDPEYILYDEPTTGLDPITADVINQLIREMQQRLHVTSVVVTHDIKSAYTVADRIVLLYQGRVMYDGTADETRHTDDAMMRQFIEGSSRGPIQPV